MPKRRTNELIRCRYFIWKLWRRDCVYQADGRSNAVNAGRHSLNTKDRGKALAALAQLDLVVAVERGMADRALLSETNQESLSLEEGRDLYRKSVEAPEIAGGASAKTWKRYRAVFDKFLPFAAEEGVGAWSQVTKALLQSYAAWLEDEGYAERTIYLELTTIKQTVKFLIDETHRLPESCRITLSMQKPDGSPTYCYLPEEVDAIVDFCVSEPELRWLGGICVALACTGMRIGELAALRWSDVDFDRNVITVSNDPATPSSRGERRRTKNRKNRSFPINPRLLEVLRALSRHDDGVVFHGPLGGRLKPDVVRENLKKNVLPKVAAAQRQKGLQTDMERGRVHSFRHFFCSACANGNVPMQMLMNWLGHQGSKMVRHYYHLADRRAQEEMRKLNLVGVPSAA